MPRFPLLSRISTLALLLFVAILTLTPNTHAAPLPPTTVSDTAAAKPAALPNVAYDYIPINAYPGNYPQAFQLNNHDQIASTRLLEENILDKQTAYRWSYDTYIDMPLFPGETSPYTHAFGINDLGHVIGFGQYGEQSETGFLWRDGEVHALNGDFPNSQTVIPYGVNNHDQIVGWTNGAGYYQEQAMLWQNNVGVLLPPYFDCPGYCVSIAKAINEDGVAVGFDSYPCINSTLPAPKATRWVNGGAPQVVGDPTSCVDSHANDINEAGDVVGQAESASGTTGFARLWKHDGTTVDLTAGIANLQSSEAIAINDNAQVLVRLTYNDSHDASALWENNELTFLQDLTTSDESVQIVQVHDLNNAGHILGIGDKGPFLLAPHDSDGDALPDLWETGGVKRGDNFIDLPAMGADPLHKDIFIHLDHMENHEFSDTALGQVIQAFEFAPNTNPDGNTGIRLHVDNGADSVMNPVTKETWGTLSRTVPLDEEDSILPCSGHAESGACNKFDWNKFDEHVKDAYLAAGRDHVFYYACSCNVIDKVTNPRTSGIARALPSTDFLITLGGWESWEVTHRVLAGTFMHELGHVLGLDHGGDKDINGKPNYLSVMNYDFQITGLRGRNSAPEGRINYSESVLPDLNENALNEKLGISDPTEHYTLFHRPPGSACYNNADFYKRLPYPAVDWNCNDTADENVQADINGDNQRSTLTSFDDWSHLQFGGGGAIGNFGVDIPTAAESAPEATLEDFLRLLPQDQLLDMVQEPVALFTADKTSGSAPLTVNLDATPAFSPNGALTNYAWTFGDGTTGNGKLTAHTFTNAGTYDVSLTVTDGTAQSSNTPLPLTITVTNGCALSNTPPALLKPAAKATLSKRAVKFDWSDVSCADGYKLQILKKKNGAPLFEQTVTASNAKQKLPKATKPTRYFWRIQACQGGTCSPFSPFRKFTLTP